MYLFIQCIYTSWNNYFTDINIEVINFLQQQDFVSIRLYVV